MFITCERKVREKCPSKCCEDGAIYLEGSDCDKFAQKVLSGPMTRADHIRSMRDEELAEAMFGFMLTLACNPDAVKSSKGYLKWLKRPYEEGNDGK